MNYRDRIFEFQGIQLPELPEGYYWREDAENPDDIPWIACAMGTDYDKNGGEVLTYCPMRANGKYDVQVWKLNAPRRTWAVMGYAETAADAISMSYMYFMMGECEHVLV